jgi:hypothetical protein
MMSWKLYDIIWVLCYFGPLIIVYPQHVDKPLRVYVYSYDFEYVLVL